MSTAPARELSQSQPEYYVWAFPGAPLRIHLKLSVVAQIREYLFKGLDPDPSQSVEAGGLLLGNTSPGRVEITGFQSFECPGQSRFFVLCDAGKSLLRNAVEKRQQSSCPIAVVGYFRSHVRDGLGLCDEDLALIADLFPDPSNVFLLVRPEENNAPLAGFFFRDGNSIFADSSFMPFPMDERLLAIIHPTRKPIEIPAQLAEQVNVQELPEKRSPYAKHLYLLSIALAAIAIGLGTYLFRESLFYKSSATTATAVSMPLIPSPPISLSASQSDTDIVITWNSHSPVISNARVGMLTIKDGEAKRDLPLTNAQLQMSKVVYTPMTGRVDVALEVFSIDDKATVDSVLLILGTQPAVGRIGATQTTATVVKGERPFTEPSVVPERAPLHDSVITPVKD